MHIYNDINAEDVQGGELQVIVWVVKTCRCEHRLRCDIQQQIRDQMGMNDGEVGTYIRQS